MAARLAGAGYRRPMKTVASAVLQLAAAAVVGLAVGSVLLDHGVNRLRDPQVTCGVHVMKPGDTCTSPDADGGPTKEGYEGTKADQTTEGYASTIAGAGFIVAGTGAAVVAVVGRRRLAARIERRRRPGA